MKKRANDPMKRITATALSLSVLFSLSVPAFAAETDGIQTNAQINLYQQEEYGAQLLQSDDGGDEDTAAAEYAITVRSDIVGGTVTGVTVTSQDEAEQAAAEEGDGAPISAKAGDTVTFTVTPADETYSTYSVGFWEVKEEGRTGALKKLDIQKDSTTYSFTMPAYPVCVGASFENLAEGEVPISATTNGQKEDGQSDKWMAYTTLHHSFLNVGDESMSAKIMFDERFVNNPEGTLILEVREWTENLGYRTVGSVAYSHEAFAALCEDHVDDGQVVLSELELHLDENMSYTEGYYAYCFVQLGDPDWVNAKGEPVYRTAYSEDATILAEGVEAPVTIVYLYNLEENSYRGSVVRGVAERMNIHVGTIDSSNLGQNIGYLAGWKGDAYQPVEDPTYYGDSFDLEYMLMCNLPGAAMDDLLAGMAEYNVKISLKSIPTAWTASKTFVELFDIMAEEDAVFEAIFALDEMLYDAEQVMETEAVKEHEGYAAFQSAYETAYHALLAEEDELELEEYWAAIHGLRDAYLTVTGKSLLEGELELVMTEAQDGKYLISARLNHEQNENESYHYLWQNNSTETTLLVSAEDLYKVKLTIRGSETWYGELTAKFLVPADPTVAISSGSDSISVTFSESVTALNTPAVTKYAAELYDGSEQVVGTQERTAAGTVTFQALEPDKAYTVKTYAVNPVGRSNILQETVTTKPVSTGGSSSGSGSSSTATTEKNEDGSTTTVVTRQDGTVIQTVQTADGVHSTTVRNAEGNVESLNVKIPSEAAGGAAGNGTTVTLPVAIEAQRSGSDAHTVEIEVTLPSGVEHVKVEIPVENMSAGVVAVDAKTGAVIKLAIPSEGGLVMQVEGDTSIKIIDNSKDFADTNGHWAGEAIDFATSRELFNGTSATAFSPNASMTRAMLMVVLARFDDHDTSAREGEAWYAEGMAWAKANGISDGTDPSGEISREQLVTMLWRYAGSPQTAGDINQYADGGKTADYAQTAMLWAMEHGLIQGTGSATLAPGAHADRAQLATILQRFVMHIAA